MTDVPGPPGRRTVAGRYALRGLLGQGGMADVELAYDEILDRQVAVKMLHERYATDPSFVERFRREAQSAAALNHPNVVAVYDTGADGRPYIVMEYVAGRSLRDLLRQEDVLPARAAEIAAEAALALGFAHDRGIVHRDIKPGNIMIGDEGQVKVTDFGIARAVNAENVTQTAAVFGTAAYVAPEQAQGLDVDGRTDIYALGCVLYEMLTSRQPFAADNAVALAYKHVSEDPIPPRQLNADVSPALEAVCLKAMAKDPAARYQSGKEMATDLRRAVAGQPVAALAGAGAGATAAFAATQALPRGTGAQHDRTAVVPVAAAPTSTRRYEVHEEELPPPGGGGRVAAYVALVILVLALVAVAAYLLTDLLRGGGTPATLAIPNVVGQSSEDAQAMLAAEGFQPRIAPEREPNDELPPNTVVRTEPTAGTLAAVGSVVTLVLSDGPALIAVPELEGFTVEAAQRALLDVGLAVGSITDEPSDEVERDRVIRTDPAALLEVEAGTPVNLVVSTGPSTFIMPNVAGLTVDDAVRLLAERTCPSGVQPPCAVVQSPVRVDPDAPAQDPPTRVVRTEPPAGEEVPVGVEVVLFVAPEATEEPTPTPEPTTPPPTVPEPTPTPTPSPAPPPPVPPPGPTTPPLPPPPAPTAEPTASPTDPDPSPGAT